MRAAAKYASLGRVTLFRLVKERAIVSRLVAPRKRLVDRESLDAWILACPEDAEEKPCGALSGFIANQATCDQSSGHDGTHCGLNVNQEREEWQ